MKNLKFRTREKAMQGTPIVPEEIKEDPEVKKDDTTKKVDEVKKTKKEEPKVFDFGKITAKDPETKKIVKKFKSLDDAIEKGFDKINIKKALKSKTKYKGYLWTSENELT